MKFFKQLGEFMMMGARAHAKWEIDNSNTILRSRKRLLILALLFIPIILGGIVFADDAAKMLPDIIGGKEAYNPSFYSTFIFVVSIFVGLGAGLITGCIGAGGGFIIAPALMSAGVKGILAVGTDLFHIFAKAIMGSVIHKKLGNVNVPLALVFLIGALIGSTAGGLINRVLYEINPVLSDAFITAVYSVMLGFLGFYSMFDFIKVWRKGGPVSTHGEKTEGVEMGSLPRTLQNVNIPPMVTFDADITPGGHKISWVFLVISGAFVGLAAGIMGVGGGFLTFPIFVYVLGVSSMTTVGTDIFQIIFTAGYASISQYAIYGFIFYTLAMGMLLGSLLGIQIGALVTKVVSGITIRGFYALSIMAGFVNRIFALPSKLQSMDLIPLSKGVCLVLSDIGMWLFFITVGGFGVWVIGTFLMNLKTLKSGEAHS
jgi:hypothetical protein